MSGKQTEDVGGRPPWCITHDGRDKSGPYISRNKLRLGELLMNNICSSNFPYNRAWQFIASQVGTRFIASVGDDATSLGDDASTSAAPDTPQPESVQEVEKSSGRKRGKREGRVVSVEEIMPKPSYWPLALAVSFVVLLIGIMISWIIIAIGAVLVIASVMGWSLERR